jgi:hypothetical protein
MSIFFLGGNHSNERQSILTQSSKANDNQPSLLESSFYKKGTSARMYRKERKEQGTSRRKDVSKMGLFSYKGTAGYRRFVHDYPSYFNYNGDHKYLERAIAGAESLLEFGAGIALIYFSCGTLCFVGEELLSSGISSLWYTCQAGKNFNWESFLMGKGVGLAFGALYQGCCVPCEISSYFIIANREVIKKGVRKAVSVIVRSMSDSVKSDLVYVGNGLQAETYLKAFRVNATTALAISSAKSFLN